MWTEEGGREREQQEDTRGEGRAEGREEMAQTESEGSRERRKKRELIGDKMFHPEPGSVIINSSLSPPSGRRPNLLKKHFNSHSVRTSNTRLQILTPDTSSISTSSSSAKFT